MKISKVDHRKAAVAVKAGKGTEGILYQDPAKDNSSVEQIVRRRTGSTKILYNIFDSGELKKDISNEAKSLAKLVNAGIGALKAKKEREEEINNELTAGRLLDSLKKNNQKKETYSDEVIDEALDTLLKNNMKTAPTKNAIKMLLLYAYGSKKNEDLSTDDGKLIKENFITKLVTDYSKSSVAAMTPKAIKNQNMVVQPDSEGHVIMPSQNKNSSDRKVREKEAFRQFLISYSVIDEQVRHDLRVKLRRIVDLYFYGESAVEKSDFDEWKIHEERKGEKVSFVTPLYKTIKKKDEDITKLDVDGTKEAFRRKNIECYRSSRKSIENNSDPYFSDMAINEFWVHYIEGEVEKLYSTIREDTPDFKFSTGYLSEKVWKGIINYLSIKYIAVGKAVYNYALEDLNKKDGDLNLGQVPDRFLDGISSFEYEKIKAEETLQRETAVAISFAANHLYGATIKKDSAETDMLLLDREKLSRNAGENIKRNILQFFGGESSWKDFSFERYFTQEYTEIDFLNDIKNIIYSLRNSSFHFATMTVDDDSWNKDLISGMFEHDANKAGKVLKDKFYSNNLPVFYSDQALEKVLHKLYDNYSERATQVPAFNNVFVRKNFPAYLEKNGVKGTFSSSDDIIKWQNALYYLYKEIYYNAFLQDSEVLSIFKDIIASLDTTARDSKGKPTNEAQANKNFKAAVAHFDQKSSMSEICQMIMTEYNQQNQGGRKKKSAYASKMHPEIFQHYKMILFKVLQETFTKYIEKNKEIYGFVEKPVLRTLTISADGFLNEYTSGQYKKLIDNVKASSDLQKWYIVSRLLNPKQTNQLIGSFRSYVQYVGDVERRARETGNKLSKTGLKIDINNIIRVMDIATKLNGVTSNNLEDYFDDKDSYARYLSKFFNYGLKESDEYASARLGEFCNEEVSGKKIGIYHDGTNPILNRNIVLCKLYGASDILSEAIDHPDVVEIKKCFEMERGIGQYQVTGQCKNKDEQLKLKKYQELKNRIELRDVVEYSEIINELQGQLINWSYLRERDLMYFQLGFHYLCLNNRENKPEAYKTIVHDGKSINGAILYQIAAMYINGLSLYHYEDGRMSVRRTDRNGKVLSEDNSKASVGEKIGFFVSYTRGMYEKPGALYDAGLELFETVSEHENIVELRNYIDHFHYYKDKNRSMLDIYGEVFDRFFSYDVKYRKNVPNMLYNILLSHFVVTSFEFSSGIKEVGTKKNRSEKKRAVIALRVKNGVSSDKFTFKLEGVKKVELTAKSSTFLSNVASLICYPEKAPANVVRNAEDEDINAKEIGEKAENNKGNKNSKQSNKFSHKDRTFDTSKLDKAGVGNGIVFDPSILEQLGIPQKR